MEAVNVLNNTYLPYGGSKSYVVNPHVRILDFTEATTCNKEPYSVRSVHACAPSDLKKGLSN
jgi:hypothetical protein